MQNNLALEMSSQFSELVGLEATAVEAAAAEAVAEWPGPLA